jgi:hypothetical protein
VETEGMTDAYEKLSRMITAKIKLTFWQRLELFFSGHTFLEWEKLEGIYEEYPIYVVKCKLHGLFRDYPHGHHYYHFVCPKCHEESSPNKPIDDYVPNDWP